MALVLNDRVKETTTTTGTGTINLAGAATNFETFVAGIGDGNTVYYAIVHQDQPEFEVGLGTVTDATPDTLSRTTILSSSNSDGLVSFSAGTKDVFCTLPATKTVFEDASGNINLADNSRIKFGDAGDMSIYHNATDTYIQNATGNLIIENTLDNKDIILKSDDGSGGVTTYFFLDGSGTRTQFEQHSRHVDNIYAAFGSDADLRIFHDGANSYIKQSSGATGNLIIEQDLTDADILFKGDDGGSTITALTLEM